MTRESEIKALLVADSEFMNLITGGVYTDQEIGLQGLTRDVDSETAAAYDEKGLLKPTVVVREMDENLYPNIRDDAEGYYATTQLVELYFYEMQDTNVIDQAMIRSYRVLNNQRLTQSYPLFLESNSARFYDVGPVLNSLTKRQVWRVVSNRVYA